MSKNFPVTVSVYLGSTQSGALELLEQIQKVCDKRKVSVSEWLVGLAQEALKKEGGRG